jgi:predicted esterase
VVVDLTNVTCKTPRPAGLPAAPQLPTYAGTCPAIAAPPAYTTITSSGSQRDFLVYRPQAIAPGEKLPLVFLWHWLGGAPDQMASKLEVQAAVEAHRFIGVIPKSKGDVLFKWPFEGSQTQARVDEEAKFFDDMLACVGTALASDTECVSSIGVSAGALWTSQLAIARSERLASIVVLSGGTGEVARPFAPMAHALPAFVLWGGNGDTYPSQVPIMNFQKASSHLEDGLVAGGHFFLECVHNCGHAVPPFDPPPAGGLAFDSVWRFATDHPRWLPAGKSPYGASIPKPPYPSWCGVGRNSATPRGANDACN